MNKMIKSIIFALVLMVGVCCSNVMVSFAGLWDDVWTVTDDEYYYNKKKEKEKEYDIWGEHDFSDGDLEDKLSDDGLYEDLFPEEVFTTEFYDRNLPESDYKEYLDEYNNQALPAEDFLDKKAREKSIGAPKKDFLHKKIVDIKDISECVPKETIQSGLSFMQVVQAIMESKVEGLIGINGIFYYFDGLGTIKTGWVKCNNKWYYFDLMTGIMVKNELRLIDGKWYYFEENGVMAENKYFIYGGRLYQADAMGSVILIN